MKTTDLSITDLFNMQRELDAEIERKHPTQAGEDRLTKRILALLVEVAECANEFKTSFKFWSGKPDDREKGVVELVDILHFVLSVGNELGFEIVDVWEYPVHNQTIGAAFIELFSKITSMHGLLQEQDELDEIDFEVIFATFLTVCSRLGVSWDEIIASYLLKNKVNFERMANGY